RERLGKVHGEQTKEATAAQQNPQAQAYSNELKKVLDLSAQALAQQTVIGIALQEIRDDGPKEVQKLKAAGYDIDSQKFYKILISTIALGTPGSRPDEALIASALDQLEQNDKLLSTSFLSLVDAIRNVLSNRGQSDSTWQQLSTTEFSQATRAMRNSLSKDHAQRMRAVENSRILLSIFSVALFGGLGLLGYRLQNSFREVADVNEQLLHANEFLEKRVAKRTSDLTKAFDDLKESQVQLVQAEKMSSLGQLVAGISHEINTPLLYLQSNQTLIKETLARVDVFVNLCYKKLIPRARPDDDKETVKKRYVTGLVELKNSFIQQEIREEIAEIKSLTEDNLEGLNELTELAQGLKDFSRLDRAPIEDFDVNDGIDRTLLIAKNMLKDKVKIVRHMHDVPLVSCSPSQINQIFLNLMTNAAQAIENDGEIVITTSADVDNVKIEFADNGCGIPENLIAKVRDPFFTTKEVGKGTGLGLSIVEEILSSHKGRLEIESEVGQGSTFTIFLPHKMSASAHESDAPSTDMPAEQTGPDQPEASSPKPKAETPVDDNIIELTV
ncbi:MAG: GHKL domain-containing protein, partial [Gammaproteobacteria bacterium]|nr:GHKL domain-containing protein [Gammaproteobacteria bacterium]